MDADPLVTGDEEGNGPEHIGTHERPADRLEERHLPPPPPANDRKYLERRIADALPGPMQLDSEPSGPDGGVAGVPVEQLQHAAGRPELADPRLEVLAVDRVDQPDSTVDE